MHALDQGQGRMRVGWLAGEHVRGARAPQGLRLARAQERQASSSSRGIAQQGHLLANALFTPGPLGPPQRPKSGQPWPCVQAREAC